MATKKTRRLSRFPFDSFFGLQGRKRGGKVGHRGVDLKNQDWLTAIKVDFRKADGPRIDGTIGTGKLGRWTRDFGLNRHIYTKGRKDNFFFFFFVSRNKRIPRGNFVDFDFNFVRSGELHANGSGMNAAFVDHPSYRRLFFSYPFTKNLLS